MSLEHPKFGTGCPLRIWDRVSNLHTVRNTYPIYQSPRLQSLKSRKIIESVVRRWRILCLQCGLWLTHPLGLRGRATGNGCPLSPPNSVLTHLQIFHVSILGVFLCCTCNSEMYNSFRVWRSHRLANASPTPCRPLFSLSFALLPLAPPSARSSLPPCGDLKP